MLRRLILLAVVVLATADSLPPSVMCSVAEAAAMLGVSSRHVRNLIDRGELPVPTRRAGTRILINRERLEAWCRGEDTELAS